MLKTVNDLHLLARSGPIKGSRIELRGARLTLGRDATCDVRLDDPKVSRLHAMIEVHGNELYFRDNGSTNGSLVNGKRAQYELLKLGDVLQLGATEFALMEASDFQTINFVTSSDTMVMRSIQTAGANADALADKFAAIFDYYKDHQVESSPIEQVELVKTQRLLNSLKSLYSVTQKMSQLLPLDKLLDVIGEGLFEVFAGAENLVILLWDPKKEACSPRYQRNSKGDKNVSLSISTTVLNKAIADRSTLVANDLDKDGGKFSASESIVDLSLKAVICAPLIVGDRVLGAMYLDNRRTAISYDEMDVEVVSAFANQAAIALDNARLCDDLQESYHQMLQALVKAIEAKDKYTMGHTHRVKHFALGIGREMGFDPTHLKLLEMAADLHDIGKIGVNEGIINKAGGLTDTEYHTIKEHVEMGEMILTPIVYIRPVLPWIRGHHERWDGTGYPDGIKGEQIPLEARILAVADSFDAMTSKRSYNKPLTFDQGVIRVREASGTHFDPQVVEAFESYMKRMLTGTKEPSGMSDAGEFVFEATPAQGG